MQATLPVTFDPALGSRLLRNQGHKEMVWEAVKKNNDPFCPSTPGAELWTGPPLPDPPWALGTGADPPWRTPASVDSSKHLTTSCPGASLHHLPSQRPSSSLSPQGPTRCIITAPFPLLAPSSAFRPNRPPSSSSRCCCRPRRGATPDLVFGGFHSSFAPPHPHRTWHPRRPFCETPSPRPRLALLSDSRASSHASRHPTTTTVDGLWPGEYEKVVALLSSVEAVPHWKHRKLATVNLPPPPSSS